MLDRNEILSSAFTLLFPASKNYGTAHCGDTISFALLNSPNQEDTKCYPSDRGKYPNWRCINPAYIQDHVLCAQENTNIQTVLVCQCSRHNKTPELQKEGIVAVWTWFAHGREREKDPDYANEMNYTKCNGCWGNHKGFKK